MIFFDTICKSKKGTFTEHNILSGTIREVTFEKDVVSFNNVQLELPTLSSFPTRHRHPHVPWMVAFV
jgi:hypothetical protein